MAIWPSYCVLGQLIWPDWFFWLVLPFLSNTRNRCCRHGIAQDGSILINEKPDKHKGRNIPKMVGTDGKPIISAKSMLTDEQFRTNIKRHLENVLTKQSNEKFVDITKKFLNDTSSA